MAVIGSIGVHPLAALLLLSARRSVAPFISLLAKVETWWSGLFLGILVCNMFGLMTDGAITAGLGFTLGLSFAVWSALLALGLTGKLAFFDSAAYA